ncbi:hypothetical protein B0H17DRAFT_1186049 [Mycena rosella]|uniref:Uncharacterized protein n=1 Tax=Mycena rosella TaxID=1033263 RepID=A0AAD7CNS6_MYCRO|nr:hypothetical protein B0H17DRAFT_1186049 [Mycena rosella]
MTMTSAPSTPRTTRSSTARDTTAQNIAPRTAQDALPDLPFNPAVPPIQLFVQAASGIRQDVGFDTRFDIFRALVTTAVTHLLSAETDACDELTTMLYRFSRESPLASDAFIQKFTTRPTLQSIEQEIRGYLTQHLPIIVFAELQDPSKGEDIPPPAHLPPDVRAKLSSFHRLAWIVSFFHELVHCVSKYLFSDHLTPILLENARDPTTGGGEVGITYQYQYFKFVLQVVIPRKDKKGHRLWLPTTQVVAWLKNQHLYVLDHPTITRIVQSFKKRRVWDITSALDLKPYVRNGNDIRYRVGSARAADPDFKDPTPSEPLVGLGFNFDGMTRMTVGCGDRNLTFS